ncbi:MAG: 16S rRNA processing protein RimM [Rickettsiales bacterium]|jgi:16S rRNA processing protein RimM
MNNIIIAKITSAHGIKGLVKIMSFTADPADINKYSKKLFTAESALQISLGGELKIKIINQIPSANSDVFTAQIEGINDRTAAEQLRGTELFIKRTDLRKASKGEFYYIDLIGLKVLDLQKKTIGIVKSVNDYGAGGLIEITFSDERYLKTQISNFAFSGKIFPEVNIEEGYLTFDLPEIVEALDEELDEKNN